MSVNTAFFKSPDESLDAYRARVTPLGGYGPTQSEVDSASQQLSSGARSINPPAGAPLAISNNTAPTGGAAVTPTQTFNSALMNLLSRYQTLGTKPFADQAYNAQTEQNSRISAPTAPALIGASPDVQNSVRSASATAVNPTIQGAEQGARTFSEQLGGFKDAVTAAREFAKSQEDAVNKQRDDARAVINEIMSTTDPSSLKGLSSDELNNLEKTAGYPKGFLEQAVTYKQKQADLAAQKALLSQGGDQNKLEQEYRTILLKPLSNRSGGLGLQDAKVNQALHLRALINQYYDPKTGQYNVPKAQYSELVMGLANLVSGTNTISDSSRHDLTQKTLAGDLAGAITYITGTPVTGSTQDVLKNLIDSIDRQGQVAQEQRDQYMSYLQALAPTGLDPVRQQKLESGLLNNYDPNYHMPGTSGASGGSGASTFSVTAPNGTTYTFKDQASLDAFKQKAGIK